VDSVTVPIDPVTVLPHRPPFLLLTRVTNVVPGERATGVWEVDEHEPFFAGHFPGRPTLPGVLMVEALAQLGAVAVLLEPRFAGKLPLFGGIDRARFRRQVVPGDSLDLDVELQRLTSKGGRGSGRASVDGQLCAEAELLFVVVDALGAAS
jgi:3-hydroxyacyl-[acyl-carrier-protein] dehydratase